MPPPRVLIIGTGSIGERHLRCFQGVAQVAACEANAELGRAVAARYNVPWYPTLEEAIRQERFEAAVVATPAHTHIPIARRCVEAGLHVLIEKPLSTSLEGIDELSAEAARAARVIRLAYTMRSVPVIAALKAKLESGVIGAPRHVTFVNGQHFPTFRPAYREIYYADHARGGGAIQDALTHSLHAVEWLIGPLLSVNTDAAHQVLEGVEVEDTVNLHGRLEGGALASFAINQFQAPNESTLTIHGTEGSLRAEGHLQRIGLYRRGGDAWEYEELPPEERDAAFIRQAAAFLAATRDEASYLATLDEGLQTLRVNLAALESVRTRKEVCL